MKLNIYRRLGLHRLFLIGLTLKILLSGLLFMIWIELRNHQDALSPPQQLMFDKLQKTITTLQHELSSHEFHEPISTTNTPVSEGKLQALKAIDKILKQLAAGEKINLSPIKRFTAENNLQQLSALQSETPTSDTNLQQALHNCLNDIYPAKQQNSIIDNFVKIEKSSDHANKLVTQSFILQTQHAIANANYTSALDNLSQLPQTIQDNTCIQKVHNTLAERVTMKEIIISIQQDLLNNE